MTRLDRSFPNNRHRNIRPKGGATVTTGAMSYWNVGTFGPDSEVFVTLGSVGTTGSTDYFELWLRLTNPGDPANIAGYRVGLEGSAPYTVRFYKVTTGTPVQLGADITGISWSVGDSLWFTAIGNTLTLYRNPVSTITWTSVGARTDGTIAGAGYLGLEANSAAWKFDNFGGGTITSSPTTQQNNGWHNLAQGAASTGVDRITTWGVNDSSSPLGGSKSPLAFDDSFNPKQAWTELTAVRGTWPTYYPPGPTQGGGGSSIPVVTLGTNGSSVQWDSVGTETIYTIRIGNAPNGTNGRNETTVIVGRTANPQIYNIVAGVIGNLTITAGQVVYVSVSADHSSQYSNEIAVTAPSGGGGGTSFSISLGGDHTSVVWNHIGTETQYKISISDGPRTNTSRATGFTTINRIAQDPQIYEVVPGTFGAINIIAGETVYIAVSPVAAVDNFSTNEIAIIVPSISSSSMTRGINTNLRSYNSGDSRITDYINDIKGIHANWARELYDGQHWTTFYPQMTGITVLPVFFPGVSGDMGSITTFMTNHPEIIWCEIINQPELSPQNYTPASYATAALSMAQSIRAVRPNAKFIWTAENQNTTNATTGVNFSSWVDSMINALPNKAADFATYCDAIGFQLYTDSDPNTVGSTPWGAVFNRIDGCRNNFLQTWNINKPFWITEFGWSTITTNLTEQNVADFYTHFFSQVASRPWITALFPFEMVSFYGAGQASGYGLINGHSTDIVTDEQISCGVVRAQYAKYAGITTPPTVVIKAPTNVTDTSATLQATINPNGLSTDYHFEWGLTTSYGNRVPASDVNIGAGTSPVNVSQNISGLASNNTYHYRVVSKNAGGTVNSSDQAFTVSTAPPPPPPPGNNPITIGINIPWNNNNASNGASNGRLDALKSEGYVLLRGAANTSAADVRYIFNREGTYTFPMTESTGFQSYVNSFFDSSGNPVPGFCGVVEIMNEVWGTWTFSGHYANGGGTVYWDAISADVVALKNRWGNKVKFLLCSQPPNSPNDGSKPTQRTWLADIVSRAQSQGQDIKNLIYGVAWHGYTGTSYPDVQSSGNYVNPSHPWAVQQFDNFFKSKGFPWKVWNTECGAGMYNSGGDVNAQFNLSTQNTWFQKAGAIALNPNSYISSLTTGVYEVLAPYCLFMESHTGHDAGAFGIIEHGSWNSGTSTTTLRHPAADTLKAAAASAVAGGSTGNFN